MDILMGIKMLNGDVRCKFSKHSNSWHLKCKDFIIFWHVLSFTVFVCYNSTKMISYIVPDLTIDKTEHWLYGTVET